MTLPAAGNLEKVLATGHFTVTAECGPPRGADPDVIRRKGNVLKE
jgi:methylenetetrahydrofolate reductase (NADPH)